MNEHKMRYTINTKGTDNDIIFNTTHETEKAISHPWLGNPVLREGKLARLSFAIRLDHRDNFSLKPLSFLQAVITFLCCP